jgi:hypothetical protein
MKCFYSGADAVGICKSCGRGLSLPFAREFPKGLACGNRCEADVERLIRVVETAPDGRSGPTSNTLVSGVFTLLAGGAFFHFGGGFSGGLSLPTFMGGAFMAFGLYTVTRACWLWRRATEAESRETV